MQRRFEGKTVVITGGSAGVGRATARAFAAEGARLGLIARGEERLAAARTEAEQLGCPARHYVADVADSAAVEDAADFFERELGPIDVWVNNAMVSVFSPVNEMQADEFRRVTEVTYLGYVYGTLSALRRMQSRGRGTIVQVGSALAYRGIPLQSAYCAAKHAVQGFTESLRTELYHDKSDVWITMVQLPALNTPQFDWVKSRLPGKARPVAPVYQPEVAAEGILWAACHRRRELNVGFSTVKAVVGDRIMPGVLDHYLAGMGYGAQQVAERDDPNRPGNLWQPAPGDHAAHGRFDAEAREHSKQLWLTTHARALAVGGAAAVAAVAGATLATAARR